MKNYFKHNVKLETLFKDSLVLSAIDHYQRIIMTLGDNDIEIVALALPVKIKHARDNMIINDEFLTATTSFEFMSIIANELKNKSTGGKVELEVHVRVEYTIYKLNITLKDISVLDKYNLNIPEGDLSHIEDEEDEPLCELSDISQIYENDRIVNLLKMFNKFTINSNHTDTTMFIEKPSKIYEDDLFHLTIDGIHNFAYDNMQKCHDMLDKYIHDNYYKLDAQGNVIIPDHRIEIEVLFQYKDFALRSLCNVEV